MEKFLKILNVNYTYSQADNRLNMMLVLSKSKRKFSAKEILIFRLDITES